MQLKHHDLMLAEFSRLACHRFTKGGYENLESQFNKMLQKNKVDEYITEFQELKKHMVAHNPSPGEQYFVNIFLSGSKKEIANIVYLHKPSTLKDSRDMSRAQECVVEAMGKKGRSNSKQFGLGETLLAKLWVVRGLN